MTEPKVSIYRRKSDNLFVAAVELTPIGGKRRRKTTTAKTRNEVVRKLNKILEDLDKRGTLPTADITVGQWLALWFEEIAVKSLVPKTIATYRSLIYKHMIPAIGKVKLEKLSVEDVRQMADTITSTRMAKTQKNPNPRLLSSTTALQCHNILSAALSVAVAEDKVGRNVAQLADAPLKAATSFNILTVEDAIQLMMTTRDDRLGSRWAAALLTGARQAELLGLEIDRVTDVLDLSWQLRRVTWEHGCKRPCGAKRGAECPDRKITAPANWERRYLTGGYWLARPKTRKGWRIIPLVSPLRGVIEQRIASATKEPNPFGLVWTSNPRTAPYFRAPDGSPIDAGTDTRAWDAALKRAKVPDVRLHDARHTTASLLLVAGVPERVIQDILGHSSYVTTRGYQHVDRTQQTAAMVSLSALLPLAAPVDAAPPSTLA